MSENFNEKFYEVSEASKMPAAESETVEIKKESVEALQEETYTETQILRKSNLNSCLV